MLNLRVMISGLRGTIDLGFKLSADGQGSMVSKKCEWGPWEVTLNLPAVFLGFEALIMRLKVFPEQLLTEASNTASLLLR